MWRINFDQSNEAFSNRISSSNAALTTNDQIHVLVVDRDKESLNFTANILEICSYKVSTVEWVSTALTRVSAGEHFDIVMADVNPPDYQGFIFLDKGLGLQMLVILMCDNEEPYLAIKALEKGAFLLIRKPFSLDMGKSLWQHVMRERLKKSSFEQAITRGICNVPKQENITQVAEDDQRKKNKGKKTMRSDTSSGGNRASRRKTTEWTDDLHNKFMDAVNRLGEGRCYPKDILELMNVPGITRMQVASHLQKCRNEHWRTPEERKNPLPSPPPPSPNASASSKAKEKVRKFGTMPPALMSISPRVNDVSQVNQICSDILSHDPLHPPKLPIGLKFTLENGREILCRNSRTSSQEGSCESDHDMYYMVEGYNRAQGCENVIGDGVSLDTIASEGCGYNLSVTDSDDSFEFPEMENVIKNLAIPNQGSGSTIMPNPQFFSLEQVNGGQIYGALPAAARWPPTTTRACSKSVSQAPAGESSAQA